MGQTKTSGRHQSYFMLTCYSMPRPLLCCINIYSSCRLAKSAMISKTLLAKIYLLLVSLILLNSFKVIKRANIRNRYNQVPHLTQDTNGKVTNSQLDITNKSQEISLLPAGGHKVTINKRAQNHNKHMTETT